MTKLDWDRVNREKWRGLSLGVPHDYTVEQYLEVFGFAASEAIAIVCSRRGGPRFALVEKLRKGSAEFGVLQNRFGEQVEFEMSHLREACIQLLPGSRRSSSSEHCCFSCGYLLEKLSDLPVHLRRKHGLNPSMARLIGDRYQVASGLDRSVCCPVCEQPQLVFHHHMRSSHRDLAPEADQEDELEAFERRTRERERLRGPRRRRLPDELQEAPPPRRIDRLECFMCGDKTPTPEKLGRHLRSGHQLSAEEARLVSAEYERALRRESPLACPFCGRHVEKLHRHLCDLHGPA